MAEVLAKAEKYINGKEALMSKRGSSSAQKEKSKDEKKRDRSPRRRRDDLHEGTEKIEIDLQREDVTSGIA